MVRDAKILILDEPSSGLDAESERLVFEGLRNLLEGRTTFVIAHHLATIRKADTILVLDQGRIVERGTHDELSGRNGLYARLQEVQGAIDTSIGVVSSGTCCFGSWLFVIGYWLSPGLLVPSVIFQSPTRVRASG